MHMFQVGKKSVWARVSCTRQGVTLSVRFLGAGSVVEIVATSGRIFKQFTIQLMIESAIYYRWIVGILLVFGIMIPGACDAVFASPDERGRIFYVSPNGNDAWSGRRKRPNQNGTDGPYRTIQRGVSNLKPGDVLAIRRGTYRQQVDVSGVKGTEEAPIQIRAYRGEAVTLDGTEPIDKTWKSFGRGIYKTKVDEMTAPVFWEEYMLMPARWPDVTSALVSDREVWSMIDPDGWRGMGTDSRYGLLKDPALAELNVDLSQARLGINRTWLFWPRVATEKWADKQTIVYKKELGRFVDETWRQDASWRGTHYFLYGAIDLLDTPGEYVYERDRQRLSVRTPEGKNPEHHRVRAQRRKYAIRGRDVRHLQIEGLALFANSMKLTNADQVTFNDLRLQYPNRPISIEGDRNRILRSSIGFSLQSAVHVDGDRNRLDQLVVHDVYSGDGSHAVRVSPGSNGTTITNSTFFHLAEGAIRLKKAPDTEVRRNHIFRTGLLRGECSPVIAGHPEGKGAVFAYNWVHDTDTWGKGNAIALRADDQSRRTSIHHNVVWNNGHGIVAKGDHHRVYNNTAFSHYAADIVIPSRPEPKKFFDQAPLLEEQNQHTEVMNNAAVTFAEWAFQPLRQPGGVLSHNYQSPDFQLTDVRNHDFRPQADSPLVDAGHTILSDHSYQGEAPDIGAYEHEGSRWVPGATNGVRIVAKRDNGGSIKITVHLDHPPFRETRMEFFLSKNKNADYQIQGTKKVRFTRRNWFRPREFVVRAQDERGNVVLPLVFESPMLGEAKVRMDLRAKKKDRQQVSFSRPMTLKRIRGFNENGFLRHPQGLFSLPTDQPFGDLKKPTGSLIQNPIFESGGPDHVEGWTFHRNGAPEGTDHGWTDTGFTGSGCVFLEVPTGNGDDFWPQWRQSWPLEGTGLKGGAPVVLNLWMKTDDVSGDGKWQGARATIEFSDQEGNRLKRLQSQSTLHGDTEWRPVVIKGTIPENTAKVTLRMMLSSASGRVWFDRVELQQLQYRSWRTLTERWNN